MQELNKLEVVQKRNFFNKAVSNINKLLYKPTQRGLYGMYISLKRKDLIKAYIANNKIVETDEEAQDLDSKYEKAYEAYMKTVDKYITDYVYKKVKKQVASKEEGEILSNYYKVISLKQENHMEYKCKKQQLLLNIEWDFVSVGKKEQAIINFKQIYLEKMESLYKSLLKNYSVQLTDTSSEENNKIYEKILDCIQDCIQTVIISRIADDSNGQYRKVSAQCEVLNAIEKYNLSQEQKDLKRNIILLSVSRNLFTHSLPLTAAEKCYMKVLEQARNMIKNSKDRIDKDTGYKELIKILNDLNNKVLSKKQYWDNNIQKDSYKKIGDKLKEISKLEKTNADEYKRQKEIIFIRQDIGFQKQENSLNDVVHNFYIEKLRQLDALKKYKNSFKTLSGKWVRQTV